MASLDINVARLKLHHDSSLKVDEELTTDLSHQTKHLVRMEGFKEVRRNRKCGFDVLTSCMGFPEEESLESLKILYQYVPVRLQTHLEANRSSPTAYAALRTLSRMK